AALSARCAICSGRTFDGPQPKRPSAGLSSCGISSVVVVGVTGRPPRGVVGSGAQARGGRIAAAPRWFSTRGASCGGATPDTSEANLVRYTNYLWQLPPSPPTSASSSRAPPDACAR